jgi:hypothetical protein
LPDGTQGAAAVAEDDDDEKLSSDQHTLSRRNAAEARRRPVCSSTIASSMRPRWKQAWPRTKYLYVDVGINHQETGRSDSHSRQIKPPIRAMLKVPYLHWVSVLGFLERPARTRRLSSEMSKQRKEWMRRALGSAATETTPDGVCARGR